MKLSMTYRVRTKGFNHIFNETVRLYRQAVSFFVDVCRNYGNRFPIYLMTHVQTPEFRESFFCSRHMVPRCRVFLFATFHASPTIIVAQQKTKVRTIQSGISQMGRLYRPERRVCRRYIRQHTLWVIL